MPVLNKAVVAGGGPVGALAAIALASQGWDVQVYERWDMPSGEPKSTDTRAYLLNLTPRSLRAFKQFGVDVTPLVAPHNGKLEQTFFGIKGQVLRTMTIPVENPPQVLRVFRDEIGRQLIDEAKRLYPDTIHFHFNCPVESVDMAAQIVSVPQGSPKQVRYEVLVAADGAGSIVRKQLAANMPEGFVRRIRHNVQYSTTGLRPPADALPGHAFFQVHQFEAGAVFLNGRGEGDVRTGLFCEEDQVKDIQAGNTQWLHEYLQHSLPALPQWAKKAVAGLVDTKPDFYPVSGWTHVSQLHGSKVVLLGDAAHTMSPILGQGLNCGLEDVAVFADVLQGHEGNVDTALPEYTAARWPDVEAMLNINEIIARSDYTLTTKETIAHKLWLKSHGLLLKLHTASHFVLNKALPSVFEEPSLMRMLKGEIPYREVMHSMYRDGIILAGILAAAGATVAHFTIHQALFQPYVST